MKVVAIVQARMASSRLPGKVLADIAGRPMLRHVVERARRAARVDEVAVATTTNASDDEIASACDAWDVRCVRGADHDVLDRFHEAAGQTGAGAVVRLTADCPLLDPATVDLVVGEFLAGGRDYVANTLRLTFPDGLDVEVFSASALDKAWRDARLPSEREHVTEHIRSSDGFTKANVASALPSWTRHLRLTVDEHDDLELIRSIAGRESMDALSLVDVVRILEREPALLTAVSGRIRNEGYYRSLAAEPEMPGSAPLIDLSLEWERRARRVIPSATQTFSKGPSQFVRGVSPVFLVRGRGSHVFDVDGNEYIDYVTALGPVILGYDDPAVTEAVTRQAHDGAVFSLPHPLEVEVAEAIVELVPSAEMVRFGKNGSDATSGAIRAARALTGRDVVACCGYHGWQDWYIGTTRRSSGVPGAVRDLTVPFAYNDLAGLERILTEHRGRVAAIIMEPVGVEDPLPGFLAGVRALADREGALLIFDEIVTGFRIDLGGAEAFYGVTPDMTCLGKAIANGYPLAAVAGRRAVMDVFDEIFFSFTFGGEAVSLAAAKATLEQLRKHEVVGHLWEQGQKLKDGYTVLARELGLGDATACMGLAPRTVVSFPDSEPRPALVLRSLLQQELVKRGVLFLTGFNICAALTDADVTHTLRAVRAALGVIARAVDSGNPSAALEGEPAEDVFRRS